MSSHSSASESVPKIYFFSCIYCGEHLLKANEDKLDQLSIDSDTSRAWETYQIQLNPQELPATMFVYFTSNRIRIFCKSCNGRLSHNREWKKVMNENWFEDGHQHAIILSTDGVTVESN